jgi:hypothetical protein
MEEEHFIYLILSKLGSAYFVFVSTFYAMREDLGEKTYEKPTLESFFASLIREEYKLVQFWSDQHCRSLQQSLSCPTER